MSEKESKPLINPSFNTMISDLRDDYINAEATEIEAEQFDTPKEGQEVKMGRKLPQWAYVGIFGTACLVVLFSVFFVATSRREQAIAQQKESGGVTAVTTDDLLVPVAFPPPATPTEIPHPATPMPEAIPEQTDPVAPEPTAWPDPPEPTPLADPPTE